jgi:acyl carrier protein
MPENTNNHTALDMDELRELVAEAMGLTADEVTDEARFIEDLDMDSLISLEISVRLEQRYGIEVGDDELKNLQSFPDVHRLVEGKLGAVA